MKKLLLSLFAVLAAFTCANAAETTILFNSLGTATIADMTSKTVEVSPITISFSTGNSSNKPAYNKVGEIRLYGGKSADILDGNTMTFTATEKITQIVLTHGSSCTWGTITADNGNISVNSSNDVTWTGNSLSVTLTVSRNTEATTTSTQARYTQAVVNTGAPAAVANPTFSVAAGTYYATQNVELACATAGAEIYYTTDGTDPDATSTKYASAITVDKDMTIKAIAINGADKSEIVSAAYVISSATKVANIAEFNAKAVGTVVEFTNPVIVSAQNTGKTNLYVQDATGGMLIFSSALSTAYKTGDVIPAGLQGKMATYNAKPELDSRGYETTIGTPTAGTLTPTELTVAGVTDAYIFQLVSLKSVTIDALDSNNNFKINGTLVGRNSLGATYPTDITKKYDIVGVVGYYSGAVQVYATSFTAVESEPVAIATPTFTPAAGTYTSAQSVVIACATSGIDDIYYTIDGTDPLTSSTKVAYTAPINVDKSMTIKAVAISGSDASEVATAEYVINSVVTVKSVAEFLALDDNAVAIIDAPLTVFHQYKNNLYVTDGTTPLFIYGSLGKTYNNGDVIPAGVQGTKTPYYGNIEFVPVASTFQDATAGTAIEPTTINAKDIAVAHLNNYVKFIGVSVTSVTVSNKAFTITQGSDTFAGYNTFGLDGANFNPEKKYDIIGIVGCHNSTKTDNTTTLDKLQLIPISMTENTTVGVAGVDADAAKVIAGVGEINVIGEAQNIAVYTMGGAKISANEAKVNCAAGLYIVVVDGKVSKVAVK